MRCVIDASLAAYSITDSFLSIIELYCVPFLRIVSKSAPQNELHLIQKLHILLGESKMASA